MWNDVYSQNIFKSQNNSSDKIKVILYNLMVIHICLDIQIRRAQWASKWMSGLNIYIVFVRSD